MAKTKKQTDKTTIPKWAPGDKPVTGWNKPSDNVSKDTVTTQPKKTYKHPWEGELIPISRHGLKRDNPENAPSAGPEVSALAISWEN